MKVLAIGDIVGAVGMEALERYLDQAVAQTGADCVIANVENAAYHGVLPEQVSHLRRLGVQVMTSGNHIFDKKAIFPTLENEEYLLRPLNYPATAPGSGSCICTLPDRRKIGVINLSGQVFMEDLGDPFELIDAAIDRLKQETDCIVVDFHAEATSEKEALGYYLDGRVSALYGTHTHVQTADERILPQGTAYITDIGMTGARESVLGATAESALARFKTKLQTRLEPAQTEGVLCGVVFDLCDESGRARSVQRIAIPQQRRSVCEA